MCNTNVISVTVIVISLIVGLYQPFGIDFVSYVKELFFSPAEPIHSKTFPTAAVASDAGPCSMIGKDVLLQGGSVVDSAIATMLCVELYNCHR